MNKSRPHLAWCESEHRELERYREKTKKKNGKKYRFHVKQYECLDVSQDRNVYAYRESCVVAIYSCDARIISSDILYIYASTWAWTVVYERIYGYWTSSNICPFRTIEWHMKKKHTTGTRHDRQTIFKRNKNEQKKNATMCWNVGTAIFIVSEVLATIMRFNRRS